MTLLPALQPIADLATAAAADTPVDPGAARAARARIHEMMELGASLLTEAANPAPVEADHPVPHPGAPPIVVRTYHPPGAGPFPAHLFLHGGGFWLGTLDQADNLCRTMVADAGCVVASVGYQLAPEATFPAPVEDGYAALTWLVDHARDLRIDPGRVTIGGESAGANLAAAITLACRDRGGPPLVGQVLEIPLTDMTLQQPSVEENAGAPGLTSAEIRSCVARYLADPADALHPHASPLLADLRGLPPALVTAAEVDPLRDDAIAYVRRLSAAGVAAELLLLAGQFHGAQRMAKVIPDEVASLRRAVARFLRTAHDQVRED